jgi:hypothetical protein
MQAPKNQDPEAWARFNESQLNLSRTIARHPLSREVHALVICMRNAASELANGGERENRIAEQLYRALAVFAQETGT